MSKGETVINEAPESCIAATRTCPNLLALPDTEMDGTETAGTQACERACQRFVDACQLDQCPDGCASLRSLLPAACEAVGQRFYECIANSSAFDCEEDFLLSTTQDCVPERHDFFACRTLGEPTCRPEPSIDDSCMSAHPDKPTSSYCVSDAVPAGCEVFAGAHYCCPKSP